MSDKEPRMLSTGSRGDTDHRSFLQPGQSGWLRVVVLKFVGVVIPTDLRTRFADYFEPTLERVTHGAELVIVERRAVAFTAILRYHWSTLLNKVHYMYKLSEKRRAQSRKHWRKQRELHPEVLRAYSQKFAKSPRGRWNIYKKNAKVKDRLFELSFEDFLTFWQETCYYCGEIVENGGIDRIDNSVGYKKENLVCCCEKCNMSKRTLSVEDFISHCRKVIQFWDSK